jgi:hypothetical protein
VAVPAGRVQQRGAFLVSDAGISWTCSRCETRNPLEATVCSVCGTTFAAALNPPEEIPDRDPNNAAMYSLFFPGAGHWYLGLKGPAVARGILSAWVVLVALSGAIAGSMSMGVIFGLAAFALWGIAAHDAYREAQGTPAAVILKSRAFVYVVMGLLMLMIIMLVSTGLRASR